MEKKVIVSRRFRRNVLSLYEYLLEAYSAKVAFIFLDKLQNRIVLSSKIQKPVNLRKQNQR